MSNPIWSNPCNLSTFFSSPQKWWTHTLISLLLRSLQVDQVPVCCLLLTSLNKIVCKRCAWRRRGSVSREPYSSSSWMCLPIVAQGFRMNKTWGSHTRRRALLLILSCKASWYLQVLICVLGVPFVCLVVDEEAIEQPEKSFSEKSGKKEPPMKQTQFKARTRS